jgi:hypothetical protein
MCGIDRLVTMTNGNSVKVLNWSKNKRSCTNRLVELAGPFESHL